ncbi:MAG: ribose 5-phosphate isomerase A [Actinobacteria bacterium]|nr:ribose 5-phosphate isomerase A [Actinomycetota bacterium]
MSETANRETAWAAAGAAAAALVPDRGSVGLGTGRAAAAGVRALGARVAAGLHCRAVATSVSTTSLARELDIPVTRLRDQLDVAFDGADIVLPSGLAVKGGGGAMVRERLVADRSRRFIVLVDAPKVGSSLDEWGYLPTAAVAFAAHLVMDRLSDLSPSRRPGRSDDGLAIIDVHPPAGADWTAIDARVRATPGIVDTGLFELDPGNVFVGAPDGSVRTLAGDAVRGPE